MLNQIQAHKENQRCSDKQWTNHYNQEEILYSEFKQLYNNIGFH